MGLLYLLIVLVPALAGFGMTVHCDSLSAELKARWCPVEAFQSYSQNLFMHPVRRTSPE